MPIFLPPAINRRSFLAGGVSVVVAASFPSRAHSSPTGEFSIVAKSGRVAIVGKSHPPTDVWCYGDRVPGPEIRVRQGEPVRIVVRNELPEETTVHWHGIRLPNAMDGVPGLTQPPIKPSEQFTYEFTPPDAGTFWYHPHADSLQQLGRGMAGALIVEEPEPVHVDRDILWMLSDWRLTAGGQIASGFGNAMEAAMSGRVGNTVTLNGAVSEEVPVRAGERATPATRQLRPRAHHGASLRGSSSHRGCDRWAALRAARTVGRPTAPRPCNAHRRHA